MADLNRSEIVGLLERLGAADDQEVLSAARGLHARLAEAGVQWDDLVGPMQSADVEADDLHDDADIEEKAAAPPQPAPGDKSDDARIIDQILARKGLSKEMRQSLAELKRGLSDGSTDAADRRYIRALARRLGA